MNTISYRIKDFLKEHHPFSFLQADEQLEIAKNCSIKYVEENESIFDIENPLLNHFFLVKDGAVGLYNQHNQLLEKCDEGDIFGLRAIIRNDTYKLSAKALEECILYTFPSGIYDEILSKNNDVVQFIIRSFASTNYLNVNAFENQKAIITEEELTINFSKNPVTCKKETSIKDAAQLMTDKKVGSILIEEHNFPIGIITDKDFRTKIATGKIDILSSVEKIMSSPVICVSDKISIAEAQIVMLKNKITHLCITKSGMKNEEILGVLSEHDIILIRENNPSVLIKQIKRSLTINELKKIRIQSFDLLKKYLFQDLDIDFINKIISEITHTLTARIIDLAIEQLQEKPPVPFSWLSLGSQGRKEQLLLTDQDNAIIFRDSKDNEKNREYFLKLAKIVTIQLHEIGYEYCPANMMASNKEWCLSTQEWKEKYTNWISKPVPENILFCTIFFDIETIYGDEKLEVDVIQSIYLNISKNAIFLNFLALNSTQNPPPLGFFRQFLLEASGAQKEQFDIKARAMMPLVDAARLLSIHQKIDVKNTIERFAALILKEPQNEEIYTQCLNAYKTLLKFRTKYGLQNNNSGRYIDLNSLNKSEKLTLKECFKAVKEIQSLIINRFQLANFM